MQGAPDCACLGPLCRHADTHCHIGPNLFPSDFLIINAYEDADQLVIACLRAQDLLQQRRLRGTQSAPGCACLGPLGKHADPQSP